MTQLNEALPVRFSVSLAVAVTVTVAAVVGVPEITPVVALRVSPAGRPVADQVYGPVPPVAARVSVVGWPTLACRVPGLVTATAAAATSQVNEVLPGILFAAVAVTVVV